MGEEATVGGGPTGRTAVSSAVVTVMVLAVCGWLGDEHCSDADDGVGEAGWATSSGCAESLA